MSRCVRCGARNAAASDDGSGEGRRLLCAGCRATEGPGCPAASRPRLIVIEGRGAGPQPHRPWSSTWSKVRARRAHPVVGLTPPRDLPDASPAPTNHATPEHAADGGRVLRLHVARPRPSPPDGDLPQHRAVGDGDACRVVVFPTTRGLQRRRRRAVVRLGGGLLLAASLAALVVTVLLDTRRRPVETVAAHTTARIGDAEARQVHDILGLPSLLHRHQAELRTCFSRNGAAPLPEELSLRLAIEPHGRVSNVGIRGEPVPSPTAEACVRAEVKRWRFPPVEGVRMEVDVPLQLP